MYQFDLESLGLAGAYSGTGAAIGRNLMKTIRCPNQYLQQRGEVWHYIRRVPSVVSNKVGHEIISRSHETDGVSFARRRRDMCAEADEACWHTLMPLSMVLRVRFFCRFAEFENQLPEEFKFRTTMSL